MAADYLGSITLASRLSVVLSALASAKAALAVLTGAGLALEASVMASLQADLDAAASVSAEISVTDPFALIQSMIAASASLSADLALIEPSIFLQANVEASADLDVSASASFAAAASLFASLNTAIAGLAAALALTLDLAAPGLHLFKFTGALDDLGTDLDTVTPDTGLAGVAPVTAYAIVVDQGNVAASAQATAFFEVGLG